MEQEIDLLDILRKIIAIRKTIYKAVGIGLIIGIIVTVSIPKQYTVEVTLSPEMGSRKSNGLSSLAASFLGGDAASSDGSDALNAFLSADIVSSTPFLLELKDMKVNEGNTTLDTYLDSQSSPWWSYVIGLPTMMVGGVKSLFSDEKNMTTTTNTKQGVLELTKKEAGKIGQLKKSISVVIEKKSAMTTVIVTFQNPKVAATVADSVVKKLQEYIISYRISKAKEDCIYLERLFKERQQEYYAAQKKYADYIDSHNNLILQSVRAEQERLQNDMSLAYQVYSQVTNQLQLARAKVQEEKPVFAVIEPAVVPLQSSGKGFVIYALVFIFLCVAVAIGWELLGKGFIKTLKEGTQNK
ncbi:Wzz/FepE/Etk N-terminal domain-containing protein [Bacteroides xylanisolvens]|jgi:uncharacterized protein involved in exopolysaccharide biosynthesis|uniref:Wzz/FepE/Etk N-terminal domain-containing protein n=1 Tax=Bacteroides xylanisolvens TaxID=371601 RepID=UPI0032BFE152